MKRSIGTMKSRLIHRRGRGRAGITLPELLMAAMLVGILLAAAPRFLINLFRGARESVVTIELQRDARNSIDALIRRLRQGRSSTVVVDRLNAQQPFRSRIEFQTLSGSTVTVWQEGRTLRLRDGASGALTLTTRLSVISFAYPDLSDPKTLQVALALQGDYTKRSTRNMQFIMEPVRMMN